MKNIAICYSEHAVKVSDLYCSGYSSRTHASSRSTTNSIRNAVTSVYRAKLSTNKQILIRLTWRNPLNQMFSITIFDRDHHPFSPPKFSKGFRAKRGLKTFELSSSKVEVLWDLSWAKYDSGPEPISGYYVTILLDSELILTLGDTKEESSEVIKKRAVSEFSLISRSEYFSGDGVYSTRAKFRDTGISHDILIKCCCGEDDSNNPALSVYVDEKRVIEVRRLTWNFRGNEVIFLDGMLVDLMWDVHDWLFSSSTGYAVFMFRTRACLESRLWLNQDKKFEENVVEFSFFVCACKNSLD